MSEVVHLKKEEYDVLIDRTTPWGNPFSHKAGTKAKWVVATRSEAIECFRIWVIGSDDPEAVWIRENIHQLKGKRLGCWCVPLACHGRVLKDFAENGIPKIIEQLKLDNI